MPLQNAMFYISSLFTLILIKPINALYHFRHINDRNTLASTSLVFRHHWFTRSPELFITLVTFFLDHVTLSNAGMWRWSLRSEKHWRIACYRFFREIFPPSTAVAREAFWRFQRCFPQEGGYFPAGFMLKKTFPITQIFLIGSLQWQQQQNLITFLLHDWIFSTQRNCFSYNYPWTM